MFKKNETMETLLSDAHELDTNKHQVFYKIPDITEWDSIDHKISLGGSSFELTDYALKQFLKKLKIPYQYYMSCSSELRDKEIREAMQEQSGKIEYIFKLKDEKIYGIVPKQYYSTLTEPFIQKIAENLPSSVSIAEYELNLDKIRVRFVSTDTSYVDVDALVPGVDVNFSEVGATPFAMQTAIYRKVCSNGLMLPEGYAPSFKMPMTRFREEQFQASVSSMKDSFFEKQKPIAELFEKFKEIPLPSSRGLEELPEELKTARDLVLPSRVLQRDYEQLILEEFNKTEDNLTVNGLLNAITRTARDIGVAEKVKLESSAGGFVSKVYSLQQDAVKHNEAFDFSIPSFKRLFKRHA